MEKLQKNRGEEPPNIEISGPLDEQAPESSLIQQVRSQKKALLPTNYYLIRKQLIIPFEKNKFINSTRLLPAVLCLRSKQRIQASTVFQKFLE